MRGPGWGKGWRATEKTSWEGIDSFGVSNMMFESGVYSSVSWRIMSFDIDRSLSIKVSTCGEAQRALDMPGFCSHHLTANHPGCFRVSI